MKYTTEPEEKHHHAASYWQTLSHKIISSMLYMGVNLTFYLCKVVTDRGCEVNINYHTITAITEHPSNEHMDYVITSRYRTTWNILCDIILFKK